MAVSRKPVLYRTKTPTATWDSAPFSSNQKTALQTIAREAQRMCIKQSVGCRAVQHHGLTVLFAGPSGTGKTLAAEVLSRELLTKLVMANFSQLKSRYIGETEKNLARVFDAGTKQGWILFFDEADALFGKRTSVKDSHDRYANQEVSYLLQRIESYSGLVILSANKKSALSAGLMRRMKHVVAFPVSASKTVARFELYRDSKKKYCWRLCAEKHAILATSSEGYTRKADCLKNIALVKQLSPQSQIQE